MSKKAAPRAAGVSRVGEKCPSLNGYAEGRALAPEGSGERLRTSAALALEASLCLAPMPCAQVCAKASTRCRQSVKCP
jgi:hypothetical protein